MGVFFFRLFFFQPPVLFFFLFSSLRNQDESVCDTRTMKQGMDAEKELLFHVFAQFFLLWKKKQERFFPFFFHDPNRNFFFFTKRRVVFSLSLQLFFWSSWINSSVQR